MKSPSSATITTPAPSETQSAPARVRGTLRTSAASAPRGGGATSAPAGSGPPSAEAVVAASPG